VPVGDGPRCGYKPGQLVRCEVVETIKSAFQVYLSLKAVLTTEEVQKKRPLGLLGRYDVPVCLLYVFTFGKFLER
jgi:hypothetical protein